MVPGAQSQSQWAALLREGAAFVLDFQLNLKKKTRPRQTVCAARFICIWRDTQYNNVVFNLRCTITMRERNGLTWNDTLKVDYFFQKCMTEWIFFQKCMREWIWNVPIPPADSGSKLYHFNPNHKDSFECLTGETSWQRNSVPWAGTIALFFQTGDDKGLLVQAIRDQGWH